MFLNYANLLDDQPSGYMNKNVSLQINSCGTYHLITRTELETCRPEGRFDYQLIYLSSGKGYFYFNHSHKPTIIDAGNMILYQPNDFQKYEYFSKDHSEVYWIHFTGNDVKNIFSNYGLDMNNKIFSCGTDSIYRTNFDQIIIELQLKKDFYEEAVLLLFKRILMSVGRYNRESSHDNLIPDNEIEDIMFFFRNHYQENINVETFIEQRGYSTSSFFRKFKKYTGMTPLQYLLHIRLSYAINLLETSNYRVNEISKLVGYDNPLYFSRLFHKHIGVSPNNYRSTILKKGICSVSYRR